MKFRIVPVGEGKFTIEMFIYKITTGDIFKKEHKIESWKPFIIHDIHPGYGGDEIWPMQATKKDCETVMRFLRLFSRKVRVKRHVHWELMQRIIDKLGIDYMYLDRGYKGISLREHINLMAMPLEMAD